jgi:serralysin
MVWVKGRQEMGAYFVDGLRNELPGDWGARWYANAADGQGAVIRYAWMTSLPLDASQNYGDPSGTFAPLDAAARSIVAKAMGLIEAVANVRYERVSLPAQADLLIGSWNIPGDTAGYANYPTYDEWNGLSQGQLMLDRASGVDSMGVILHELGHTLGLEHSFEGSDLIPESQDKMSNTVMSYTWDIEPQALGVFDVIALQSIYGPARKRTGDDTYVFGRDKVIWDGGGHDRIDAGGADKAVRVSLDDGSWNWVGSKTSSFLSSGQVWLGHFTRIEELKGSRQADRLYGSERADTVWGGAGGDFMDGKAGTDRIHGQGGWDTLEGGTGDDRLHGGGGDDSLRGEGGRDVLRGNEGADRLSGGAGADIFSYVSRGDSGRGEDRDVIAFFGADDRVALAPLDLTFIGHRAFTGAGDELRVVSKSDEARLLADFNGNGTAEFEIVLRGITDVTANDLIL